MRKLLLTSCMVALSAAASTGSASASPPAEYVIAVGDELMLDFLDDATEPYPLKVGFRGDVQLPWLGTLSVADLPLATARQRIHDLYVENELFVAPRLELSILNHRPVSVLGDVRTPGTFAFLPAMTVEQAVGMAGGALTPTNTEEARILQRAGLRGELKQVANEVRRDAATAARLRAQLAGQDVIDPAPVADLLGDDPEAVEELLESEQEILWAEAANHGEQLSLIDQAIGELERELRLTASQIAIHASQLAISTELAERGLRSTPAQARRERVAAEDDAAILRLEAHLAQSRRELSTLKREKLTVIFERSQGWRRDLVERERRIEQQLARQEILSNQLYLLADWSRRLITQPTEVIVEYQVRHRTMAGLETRTAAATDELLPGDVVLVNVVAPEAALDPALRQDLALGR